jgi:hypothetical protein
MTLRLARHSVGCSGAAAAAAHSGASEEDTRRDGEDERR